MRQAIFSVGWRATVARSLIKEFSEIDSVDKTLFLSSGTEIDPEIASGFVVRYLRTPRSRVGLEVYDQVVGPIVLMHGRFDKVICINSIVPLLYPGRIDLLFQMRMFHFENLDSWAKKVKNLLGRASIRKSHTTFVASLDHKRDLVEHLRLSEEKIKVAHLAVRPVELEAERSVGLERNYFLFVSVIRPYKNLHGLVEAYLDACKVYPNLIRSMLLVLQVTTRD